MELDLILQYLEHKVATSGSFTHDLTDNKKAFYVIDDPYNLSEFDEAIRSMTTFPAMLVEQLQGQLDDNDSANYTDTIQIGMIIIDKRAKETIRTVRNRCFHIGKSILTDIRKDVPQLNIIPDKYVTMRIDNIPYTPVGPIADGYYGYIFQFEFIVPFTF